MDVSRRRAGLKTSVVAGSVWETRMKAFNGGENQNLNSPKKVVPKKTPIAGNGKRKTWKSESFDRNVQIGKELSVSRSDEKIPIPAKNGKSDSPKTPIQITKSGSDEKSDPDDEIEKNPLEFGEIKESGELGPSGSEDSCKEFGVCEEQTIEEDEEKEEEKEEAIEVEIEKKIVVKSEEEKPEINEQKPNKNTEIAERRVYQLRNRTTTTTSSSFKQSPPVMRRAEIYKNLSNSTKPTSSSVPVKNEYQNFQERHSKLQNLVDLIMWRDISRSAFVFGIGTFIIISSSYTQDLNVSFISVISYMGLAYLAAIFLYRSLICRGIMDINDASYGVGEEEAIWIVKLFLPYLNESLLKIKALFSGDPATTMKMAVVLFVFARCGSSITIWKMAKLGFFGVFTVPKVGSKYSQQLTAYAKFWIRRFGDAWDSCTHKKAVALAIFSLVWNLSSMVARVWAVFMMFVAVRYYQQSMESDDWVEVEDEGAGAGDIDTLQGQEQINKLKKGS